MAKIDREKMISTFMENKNFDDEKSNKICDILESSSVVGRKNKEKIMEKLMTSFPISYEEANHLYNDCMEVYLACKLTL